MTNKAQKAQDKANALETLRAQVRPGTTVYTVLRHVSASGMSRSISLLVTVREKDHRTGKMTTRITTLDYRAAQALGYKIDQKHGGLKIGGAGMDMGFHLVYNLGRTLFPNGGDLKHSVRRGQEERNGETRERDGGYILRHEWL